MNSPQSLSTNQTTPDQNATTKSQATTEQKEKIAPPRPPRPKNKPSGPKIPLKIPGTFSFLTLLTFLSYVIVDLCVCVCVVDLLDDGYIQRVQQHFQQKTKVQLVVPLHHLVLCTLHLIMSMFQSSTLSKNNKMSKTLECCNPLITLCHFLVCCSLGL